MIFFLMLLGNWPQLRDIDILNKIKDDFLFPADCQLAISDWMLSDLQFRAESEDVASVSVFYTLSVSLSFYLYFLCVCSCLCL